MDPYMYQREYPSPNDPRKKEAMKMLEKLGRSDEKLPIFDNNYGWGKWFKTLQTEYYTSQNTQNSKQSINGGKSKKLRRGKKVKRGGDNKSNAKCAELQQQVEKAQLDYNELVHRNNGFNPNSYIEPYNKLQILKDELEKCQSSNTSSGGKARRTRRTNKVKKSGKKARKSGKKSRKTGKKARKTHRRRR